MSTQCIDIYRKQRYNLSMQHKYEVFKIKELKFVVKLDLNPITNDFDYHMYIRHLITPQQAIAAYFTKSYDEYNETYDRHEAYSEKYDISIFYTYLQDENILLITAFKGAFYEN